MTLVMVVRCSSVSWSRSARRAVDVAAGRVERPALGTFDEQVVDGDAEDLGHADDGFEAGATLLFSYRDLAGVRVDLLGKVGLGQPASVRSALRRSPWKGRACRGLPAGSLMPIVRG